MTAHRRELPMRSNPAACHCHESVREVGPPKARGDFELLIHLLDPKSFPNCFRRLLQGDAQKMQPKGLLAEKTMCHGRHGNHLHLAKKTLYATHAEGGVKHAETLQAV